MQVLYKLLGFNNTDTLLDLGVTSSLFAMHIQDFIVSPTSQTVPIEEDAEFRCQHDSADILRWRVNGSLISLSNRPDGVQFGVADPVITLTIPAFLEYNGTEVVCVAQFDSGSPDQESNPPAILFVSGNL